MAQITLTNKKGDKSAPLGKHRVAVVPIEHVKAGQWVRPSHPKGLPFQKTSGDPVEEPRSSHDAYFSGDDDYSLYSVGYKGGRIDPHYPEGTGYHVLFRDRRKS